MPDKETSIQPGSPSPTEKATTASGPGCALGGPAPLDRGLLLDLFLQLLRIDSPSGREGRLARWCRRWLEECGATCRFDGAHDSRGGQVGNLHAHFPGLGLGPPKLLVAHLDTVAGAVGVEPLIDRGCVRTDGSTPLGADDKAGVAAILALARSLGESRTGRPDVHLLLTVQEETGLHGARHADLAALQGLGAYVLDGGPVDRLIHRAPAKNRFRLTFQGREAHLTMEPELGLNAALMAAEAVAAMPLGRLDPYTTANVESISTGGEAGRVPSTCTVEGEISSLDEAHLEKTAGRILRCAEDAVRGHQVALGGRTWSAEVAVQVERLHPSLLVAQDHPLVEGATAASARLGRSLQVYTGWGGSDANILAGRGVPAVVLGTGMSLCHTPQENIRIEDLCKCAELVLEIIAGG